MKKTSKLHLSRLLTRKYLTALGALVAIIAAMSLYNYTHPDKNASIKSCTSELATAVTKIDYNFSSALALPAHYRYVISLDCNGSKLDLTDTSGRHFTSNGKNDAASQQIIAALAADLASRVPTIEPNQSDCTSQTGVASASITLVNTSAKTATAIALCKFPGDERVSALVDQIKALIPNLDAIVSSHT